MKVIIFSYQRRIFTNEEFSWGFEKQIGVSRQRRSFSREEFSRSFAPRKGDIK